MARGSRHVTEGSFQHASMAWRLPPDGAAEDPLPAENSAHLLASLYNSRPARNRSNRSSTQTPSRAAPGSVLAFQTRPRDATATSRWQPWPTWRRAPRPPPRRPRAAPGSTRWARWRGGGGRRTCWTGPRPRCAPRRGRCRCWRSCSWPATSTATGSSSTATRSTGTSSPSGCLPSSTPRCSSSGTPCASPVARTCSPGPASSSTSPGTR